MEDNNFKVESRGGDLKLCQLDENDAQSMKNDSSKNGVYTSDPELASTDDATEIEKVERVYRMIDKRIIPRKLF